MCFGKKKERGVSRVSVSVRSERFLNVAYMLMSPAPSFLFCMLSLICLPSNRSASLHVERVRERKKIYDKKVFPIHRFSHV